jgi:hypothetical protein
VHKLQFSNPSKKKKKRAARRRMTLVAAEAYNINAKKVAHVVEMVGM